MRGFFVETLYPSNVHTEVFSNLVKKLSSIILLKEGYESISHLFLYCPAKMCDSKMIDWEIAYESHSKGSGIYEYT